MDKRNAKVDRIMEIGKRTQLMRNGRYEFALCDVRRDRFDAADLCTKAVTESGQVCHVLLCVEESIGLQKSG